MLTLYHAPRARAFRTLWLREAIGSPYEIKAVSIRRGDGSGTRDSANPHPHGKVPALVHNGALIYETTAIALYLTDAFPDARLGPKIGEADRGAYVTWLSYYSGVFQPSPTAKVLQLHPTYRAFGWAPFEEVVEHLTATLQNRLYFLGELFSAVDVVFGGSMPLLMSRQILPENDIFKDYVTRITARQAFARTQAKDAN